MPETVEELYEILDLEQIEVDLFRGRQPATGLQRAFGGQVLAQALTAANRTVTPDRLVHSLHGYFLLPGRVDAPILYDVEVVRDGGSFSSRRVVARQHGHVIFYLSASFHVTETGFEHTDAVPSGVPAPEQCPKLSDVLAELSGRSAAQWEHEWGVLDVRYAGDSRPGGALHDPERPALARAWVRLRESSVAPPTDEPTQRALLAYASDLTLLSVSTVPHHAFIGSRTLQAASLDHALWFHRPVRMDRWLLYDQSSPSASAALGLSLGRLFADGAVVASVAQEGLIRPVTDRDPTQPATHQAPSPTV